MVISGFPFAFRIYFCFLPCWSQTWQPLPGKPSGSSMKQRPVVIEQGWKDSRDQRRCLRRCQRHRQLQARGGIHGKVVRWVQTYKSIQILNCNIWSRFHQKTYRLTIHVCMISMWPTTLHHVSLLLRNPINLAMNGCSRWPPQPLSIIAMIFWCDFWSLLLDSL